ncbi:hypothetical protein L2E82_32551 [Cichorium intybus]|uniref:Uncharacterized protein n=1 Tax=Cichorium intybus TaxID=13427 RepID=A0ACB9BH39_CICIN|nr:hypothetical protein L2E82_32551 [Cichorium intybus]
MPEYLRLAIKDVVASRDIDAIKLYYDLSTTSHDKPPEVAPESPLIVFINSKSSGRYGSELIPRVVLGCLGELQKAGRNPVPPTAIVPLGTGNDLSRSFGWGGSFPFNRKAAIKKTLDKATRPQTSRLDSWNLVISMPDGTYLDTPYSLKRAEEVVLDQVDQPQAGLKALASSEKNVNQLRQNFVNIERKIQQQIFCFWRASKDEMMPSALVLLEMDESLVWTAELW